jgi:type IV secretion system protein VirB5
MKRVSVIVLVLVCTLGASGSHAQFAVIDVNAITQMAQQLRVLQDQLANARSQLTQAQAQFAALTGSRGMERLLAGATRTYLPPDWAVFERTLRRVETSYAALGLQIDAVIQGNAVLTPAQTAHLVPDQREQLEAARRTAALLQVTSRQALQVSSERFGALQALIDGSFD